MGGEGSMAAANNSLKNNRSLLSKRKDKGGLEGSYANIELKEFPKASEEDLIRIKERIKQENKRLRIKQLLIFGILLLVLFVLYFKI